MRIDVYPDREGKGMMALNSENQKDRERLQAFIDGHPPQRRFIVEMMAGKVDYNREIQIGLEFIQVLPEVEPSKEPEKRISSVEDLPSKIRFLAAAVAVAEKNKDTCIEQLQDALKEIRAVLKDAILPTVVDKEALVEKINMLVKE